VYKEAQSNHTAVDWTTVTRCTSKQSFRGDINGVQVFISGRRSNVSRCPNRRRP